MRPGEVRSSDAALIFLQRAVPMMKQEVRIGDLWIDTNAGDYTMKKCTSLTPITFVSLEEAQQLVSGAELPTSGVSGRIFFLTTDARPYVFIP